MPGSSARKFPPLFKSASRIGYRCGIALLALVLGSESLQTAVANGDTRSLYFQHTHRDDEITITFKRDGRYVQEALQKLNWYLRDWRTDEQVEMDPRLFDLLWEVRHEFGDEKPIRVISSYRSPKTNSMLRRRGRGVARFSQHMQGKAIDFYIPDVPLADMRVAGLRLQRGGVGYYPNSGSPFIHLDVARVRHWPRMTREQLVQVFPDGRTVHIPQDGQPLKNYKLALADIQRRGNGSSSLLAARDAGVSDDETSGDKPNLNSFKMLAKLFGFGNADEDEDRELTSSKGRAVTPRPATEQPKAVAAAKSEPDTAAPTSAAAAVPLPTKRPATYQIASAAAPARPSQAASVFATASLSSNEIIKQRGYWRGLPEAQINDPSAAPRSSYQLAAATPEAADAPRQASPPTTASITPWPVKPQNDRVSPELALSYAAQESPRPAPQAAPMGARMPANLNTAAIPPQTTVATKATADRPTTALTAQNLLAAAARARADRKRYDPWLRAMVIAPDARRFMSTALFGMPNFHELRPQMRKPSSAVMMTFGVEPYIGLGADRFTGSAIVFVSTVTFDKRVTAALQ